MERGTRKDRSHHLSGRQPPDLQPFDPSVVGHHACLLDIVLGQGRMTKGSQRDRVVAVRRHNAQVDRDLKFSSFMSLGDLCDDFKMSHSFDKVICHREIICIFFSCFLILYYFLVKHPSFSSWKSPKNSPDSISSQYLSPNHLNVTFWEMCGTHCY